MSRPFRPRLCVAASLVLPALVFLTAAWNAEAQPGYRLEREWRCSRCNGYLGNGVQSPTYCHHCNTKLIGDRDRNWYGNNPGPNSARSPSGKGSESRSPFAIIAVSAVALLALGGLVLLIMNSTSPGRQ